MAGSLRLETDTLTGIHWVAIVLAAITGVIHLVLGVQFISESLGPPFLLAGLGFFGAIVLFLVNYRRRLLYVVGVAFTGVQVIIYYLINFRVDGISPVEGVDKAVQLLLIVVLIVLYRREG